MLSAGAKIHPDSITVMLSTGMMAHAVMSITVMLSAGVMAHAVMSIMVML